VAGTLVRIQLLGIIGGQGDGRDDACWRNVLEGVIRLVQVDDPGTDLTQPAVSNARFPPY